MKKSQWNEYELIKLLQKLPEVEDKRSRSEVYHHVNNRSIRKRKQKKNWIPLFAATAALLLVAVLGASILNDESTDKKSPSSQFISMDQVEKQEDKKESNESDYNAEKATENKAAVESDAMADEKETLNDEDYASKAEANESDQAAKREAVTIGVPDDQSNYIIPITVSSASASLAQALVEAMTNAKEEAWGLTDYYPLDITISDGAENNQIIIDLSEDSPLITLDSTFLAALQETVKYNQIESVVFTTNGQPGVSFSHAGMLKTLEISKFDKKAFLLYQLHETSRRFLAPSNISYDSITDALASLKEDPGIEGISPSVPQTIGWDNVREHKRTLEIDLSNDTRIDDTDETRTAIEAILFTAKDFGFEQVQLFNASINQVQELDLSAPITIPAAPNYIE